MLKDGKYTTDKAKDSLKVYLDVLNDGSIADTFDHRKINNPETLQKNY
jgi:hypothetical protein